MSSSNKMSQTDASVNNGFQHLKKALDKLKGFHQHLKTHSRILFHSQETTSDNVDYLRMIGAGLSRTGTTSVKAALELLGFGPCYKMTELFKQPQQSILSTQALDGHKTDFYELMKGHGSSVDIPEALFYK
ncbi:unnamed protein product [Rotaria sp. Silwood1]|nr:unnamed protein product [Rotaria sp. Silwood1]CAF4716393.1 unnamed protein product [Rotaria sp. Silwood1]CAF4988620.1 unnamed protein product [Rotaria sp. Silwood1]